MAERRIDWDSHRRDAEAEDVAFLTRAGLSLSAAAARVGVHVKTLERRDERAKA